MIKNGCSPLFFCNFAPEYLIIIDIMVTTTIREEGNLLIMTFEGRFDTASYHKTAREMNVLYESTDHDYLLDLTNLRYISSSGLRLFLTLLQHARKYGRRVDVTGLSDFMQQVFDETGFTKLFSILHSQV